MKSHEEIYMELMQAYTWQAQLADVLYSLLWAGLAGCIAYAIVRSRK